MNLTSASQVKSLLEKHNLHPKKRLGQNFLIDRNVLNRVLEASEVSPEANVLEIGPGLGVVTSELIGLAARIVCVDIDKTLQPVLDETLGGAPNVEVIIADFLKLNLPEFLSSRADGRWIVIGNLPYYITTPIISKLLDTKSQIALIIMMVQREVAARLMAKPGSDDYGSLSVFVQYHCDIESVMKVSRNVFYPVPDVDSEIIKLIVREQPRVQVADENLFFRIVRASFGKRRKTLFNALGSSTELNWDKEQARRTLEAAGIDGGRRGETLSIEEFSQITHLREKR